MAETIVSPEASEERSLPPRLLVVGIGASAGGVRAMSRFFGAVPPQSGMAYVAILHLSPTHESSLAEVLQSATSIPVTQVRSRVRVEADHVYVVPPNKKLLLVDGHIEASDMVNLDERRAPIDIFFRTLADVQGPRAVSVVLSGTGADGSLGMKRVREHGGLCIAQQPDEAEFPDMPRNAIATGLADFVMPVTEIPARLVAFRKDMDAIRVPVPDEGERDEKAMLDIFSQLRVRTGHDFANYKRSTVARRLERRMSVNAIHGLANYAKFLNENRDEARALLKDLLISVTNFFRTPEAFAALEAKIVPRLFEGKGPQDQVRVWVAGCATGEEAYSIAMLLAEYIPEHAEGPSVQVFATDIDEAALAKARAGLYIANDSVDLSPERLRRFFVKDGEAYRVRRELREMVLFAPHNIIKDPPFSHLDLVTCRNLLIYLNRPAQERVLKVIHFGLNPGGFLFLGSSESADEIDNLYVAVDKESRIYQSRGVERGIVPPIGVDLPAVAHVPAQDGGETRARDRLSYQELHLRLLEKYAPPSIIIDHDHEILHLSERAGRYLQFSGGEPSQNLLRSVRPELRLELHSALYLAMEHRSTTEATAGPVNLDGRDEFVKMTVSPVFGETDTSRGMVLVLFDVANPPGADAPKRVVDSTQAGEPIARQLEEQVVRLKMQLRTTIEQYELQQEELKASNEELQAMNEELRSSTEELETGKEELQSVNEELSTVNQELKIKIEELSHANNDTRNLMNSTDIATVFVDRSMRIKLFTPRARTLFNLLAADAGRPLLDITHRLHYPEMSGDIEHVLETLSTTEREVASSDGQWYIARAVPYRTGDDRIAGVVLTFTDFTRRKQAEQLLRESEEYVRLVIDGIPEFAIFTTDTAGLIKTWNPGAVEMFGYGEGEIIGQHLSIIFTPEDRAAGVPEKEMQQARETGRAMDERWHIRQNGERFYVSGVAGPLRRNGVLVGYTKIARDLTKRENADRDLRDARDELETRVGLRTSELAQANEALRREIAERVQSEEARVKLLREVVNAQERERSRISRELHDQLGQEVTALGVKLAVLKGSPELKAKSRDQIEDLEKIVKQIDGDVEFLAWELRPTGLDDLGLGEALADYVASWSRYFGVHGHLESKLRARLPADIETILYRIGQEALNNVAKHARAKTVTLVLARSGNEALLSVKDDGVGFEMSSVMGGRTLGLLGMRERAALVGGSTSIESRLGGGTTVSVRVPLHEAT